MLVEGASVKKDKNAPTGANPETMTTAETQERVEKGDTDDRTHRNMGQGGPLYQATDMAEEELQQFATNNTVDRENIEMIGDIKHPDANTIGKVCRLRKAALLCEQCGEKGTFANIDNTRFNGKTNKCANCGTQYSGETVVNILNKQLGIEWRSREYSDQMEEVDSSKCIDVETTEPRMDNGKAISVPGHTWDETLANITMLAEGYGRLQKEQKWLIETLERTNTRMNKLENDLAVSQARGNMQPCGGKLGRIIGGTVVSMKAALMRGSEESQLPINEKEHDRSGNTKGNASIVGEAMDVDVGPYTGEWMENRMQDDPNAGPGRAVSNGEKILAGRIDNGQSCGHTKITERAGTAYINGTRSKYVVNHPGLPEGGRKVNWAGVVKGGSHREIEMPGNLTGRMERARHRLQRQNICTKQEPQAKALYFKNIWRGPIEPLRQAKRESLQTWVLLGLSFIEGSILEVVTDE